MDMKGLFSRLRQRLQRGRILLLTAGLALTLLMTVVYALRPVFFTALDNKLYDLMLRRQHNERTSGVPVIVDIDEASLAELGQWPWPRYRIARLLEKLRDLGVAAAALDIVFPEPDRSSLDVLQATILQDFRFRLDLGQVPPQLLDNDATLAAALGQGPFVLGYHFNFAAPNGQAAPCSLHKLNLAVLSGPDSPDLERLFYRAPNVVCNVEPLGRHAPGSGFFNALPDPDGILRHAPLLIEYRDAFYPSLALAAYLQAFPTEQIILWLKSNPKAGIEAPALQLGERIVPLAGQGQTLLHFRGPRRSFPYIPAADVLLDRLPPGALAGKVAFIGTSAAGLKDIRTTPLDQLYPGVEVHATVLDNLIVGDFLLEPEYLRELEVLLVLGMGLLSTLLLTWTGATWSLLPLGACVGGLWYGAAWTFGSRGLYLSPLIPTLTLGLNFTLLTLLKFWREESQRRFFHTAFSRYVSKAVVEQMVKSPDKLSLSGEEREVSILFSDIRGFTSLSEQLSPHQVSELLQGYFTPMTARIIATDGTLDKFIGDAIMAFWNAPLDTPGHQERAVRSALGMQEALAELNLDFKERFNLELQIGIGLHCGRVRVGNMGSKDLFDYTIIGDNVNLASRLEGLTKYYGLGIVVSESIRQGCDGELYFQEVDTVRVKGKARPIGIFTPHTASAFLFAERELELYGQALDLYKAQDFARAGELFQRLGQEFNPARLYALYVERCRSLLQNPPGADWDHVFTHESK